jgi:hypothetical protein
VVNNGGPEFKNQMVARFISAKAGEDPSHIHIEAWHDCAIFLANAPGAPWGGEGFYGVR